jgi:hypothetical protein
LPGTRIAIAALALLAVVPAIAHAGESERAQAPTDDVVYRDGHGGRFLLGGRWLSRLDPTDQGLAQGFATQTTTDGWNPTTVPHA